MFGLGAGEFMALAILGVLLFGKRLPEVGRSLGKTVMEFKNGLRDVENEFSTAFHEGERTAVAPAPPRPERIAPTAPKFEEPAPIHPGIES